MAGRYDELTEEDGGFPRSEPARDSSRNVLRTESREEYIQAMVDEGLSREAAEAAADYAFG